ncbi:RidA family protein [Desertimonas flava]|uniref:RidA family protein n=1 Tax=Desertimonas flava TaxID=2064846 RepID=UPI000E342800|nr:RidA family protein [Desertimonas flava]
MRDAIELAGPAGPLPFSPAVRANGFVFVSGQASVDEAGNIVGGDLAFEFRRSFEGVQRVLAADGLTLDDVVQVRMYVRDPADLAEANVLYREWFTPPYPARTTLTGCLPETLRFEVDVVAARR